MLVRYCSNWDLFVNPLSSSRTSVSLELVIDLSTECFIACLRRFVARRGKPCSIWSDHGTNFVGANRVLRELRTFLMSKQAEQTISTFCSTQGISWHFISEKAPHFGGLWEAAVKSFKIHLRRVVGDTKLTFEQIEACLNSRPLGTLPPNNDDGIEILTPGHFLSGRPLQAIPDHPSSYHPMPILKTWYLCEALVRHFWEHWSCEYLVGLRKHSKWRVLKGTCALET